jgi:Ala-tRNA(Pro) deacylase
MLAKLRDYLDSHGVEYVVSTHRPTFTAMDAASVEHVPPWEHAKVIVVTADHQPGLAVLRASDKLDLQKLPSPSTRLVSEAEMSTLLPTCEVGAIPPFGRLFGMPVYVDRRLASDPWISFLAGSHGESVRMRFVDFERLVSPTIDDYGVVPDED